MWRTCFLFLAVSAHLEPEQIHLAFAGQDASGYPSGMTASWFTRSEPKDSTVEYGLSASHVKHYMKDEGFHSHVEMLNLKPNTKYFYRVGSSKDGKWSEACFNQAKVTEEFTYESAYNGYLNWLQNLTATMAYMVSPGNHESECHSPACVVDPFLGRALMNFTAYNHRWHMPSSSSAGRANMWYSWNVGPVHFVSLNTETDFPGAEESKTGEYLRWLEADLKAARAAGKKWIIAGGHRPLMRLKHSGMIELLEKYKVDLYLAGHAHRYWRDPPSNDVNASRRSYQDPNGYIQIVAGGAGCDEMAYKIAPQCPAGQSTCVPSEHKPDEDPEKTSQVTPVYATDVYSMGRLNVNVSMLHFELIDSMHGQLLVPLAPFCGGFAARCQERSAVEAFDSAHAMAALRATLGSLRFAGAKAQAFPVRSFAPAFRCFSDLRFAPTHEWFKAEGDSATLGISDFAQGQLGEVVYCELPEVGSKFKTKETLCTLESVKAVGEVYAPVDCEVTAVNEKLQDEPATVNGSPEDEGWLVKVKFSGDTSSLMDRAAYEKHLESEKTEEHVSFDREYLRWLWWPVILYLFWGMAHVCDIYFVSAIEVVTKRFKIPDDVAGATLMALGCNGPELSLNTKPGIASHITETDRVWGLDGDKEEKPVRECLDELTAWTTRR
eukprot:Skav216232  [mRNA]  locus=scaffold238:405571:438131:+ [translate_table: standard]